VYIHTTSSDSLDHIKQQIGLIPIDTSNPLEALIFGALISAVDPVATLSIIGWVDWGVLMGTHMPAYD
jgi:hypothetical protein